LACESAGWFSLFKWLFFNGLRTRDDGLGLLGERKRACSSWSSFEPMGKHGHPSRKRTADFLSYFAFSVSAFERPGADACGESKLTVLHVSASELPGRKGLSVRSWQIQYGDSSALSCLSVRGVGFELCSDSAGVTGVGMGSAT